MQSQEVDVFDDFDQFEAQFQKESGVVYVVNYWATWCKPCVKEMPYLEALTAKYALDNVRVILVSMDFAEDIPTKLLPFLDNHSLKSKVIALTDIDYNDWIDKVHPDWSGAIPATVFYYNEEIKFHEGEFSSLESIENIIEQIKNKP